MSTFHSRESAGVVHQSTTDEATSKAQVQLRQAQHDNARAMFGEWNEPPRGLSDISSVRPEAIA